MDKVIITYSRTKELLNVPYSDIIKIFEKSMGKISDNISITYLDENKSKLNISFGLTLPIGMESIGELIELTLFEKLNLSFLIKEINNVLPSGLIALSAEYDESPVNIIDRIYAVLYEIEIDYTYGEFANMNQSKIEEEKKLYTYKFLEYLGQSEILVVKKFKHRMERIDIKPKIQDYDFLRDGNLLVKVIAGEKIYFNPNSVMVGFNEYINQNLKYTIKRIKTYYN